MKYFLALFALLFTGLVYAFQIETKPINVIMPFPPGGGVDQTFRHFEKYVHNKNIKLVPVYKPGANGIIGVNEIFMAKPDGYTIFLGTTGSIAEFKIKNPDKDLIPISMVRTSIMAVVGKNNSNIKTFSNLETAIKNNEKLFAGFGAPGQKIVINQILEKIKNTDNVELVSYKGASSLLQDLSGSHVNFAVVPFSVAKPLIDSNKIILLATDSSYQIENYNTTLLPKYFSSWDKVDGFILALPPNTPKHIVDIWTKIIVDYVNDPVIVKEFKEDFMNILPVGSNFAELMIQKSISKLK